MRKAIVLAIILTLIVPFFATNGSAQAQTGVSALDGTSQTKPAAQGVITPQVQAALDSLSPGEKMTVIVTLVDQADLSRIPGAGRTARQQGVIRALQAKADATQRGVKALLAARSAQGKVDQAVSFWVFNGLSVTATADVIQELAMRSDVLSITPDEIQITPVSTPALYAPETNLSVVNAPALWDMGYFGQGVVVANMDSGVDANHPDLSASWRGGSNSWFDPHGEHPNIPTDLSGHGTGTMGIMVGGETGGTAIGLAPQASWIAVKIFDDQGGSNATAIHQGYQWLLDPDGDPATADAPHVVNNSWTFAYPGCDLEFELDIASLRAAGVLPVFAAGNGGPSSGTSYSPANNPSAFAVGATDNNDQIYGYSSRGPSNCGESSGVFPELVAPGVGIHTADLYGLYTDATGTSMAAPHVAGGLALLISADASLSDTRQEDALIHSALDLGIAGPDDEFGYGRLDLSAAYQWLIDNPPATPTPTPTPDPNINLALNKTASVSSSQDSGHTGDMALDGDLATFWKTERAKGKNKLPSEWIEVDLGSSVSIGRVVLEWDVNFATSYNIQVSVDQSNWTTVFATTAGDGGGDMINFSSTPARYVRMESTSWSSGSLRNWLKEFEVYAGGGTTPTPTPTPSPTPMPTPTPGGEVTQHIGDLDASANRKGKNWKATITFLVHDASETALVGASVSGTWSTGATGPETCLTDESGVCSITSSNIKGDVGSATFTVTDVSYPSGLYDPGANHDPDGDGDGSSITVLKP